MRLPDIVPVARAVFTAAEELELAASKLLWRDADALSPVGLARLHGSRYSAAGESVPHIQVPFFRAWGTPEQREFQHSTYKLPMDGAIAQIYALSKDAVARLDADGSSSSSFRVLRHEMGDVYATARHGVFVDNGFELRPNLRVQLPEGPAPARVIGDDRGIDSALVLTKGSSTGRTVLELGSKDDLKESRGFALVGFPEGVNVPTLSDGKYLDHRIYEGDNGFDMIRGVHVNTSVPAWHGYSGAPYLYMRDGMVRAAGVVTTALKNDLNKTYGYTAEQLVPLLDSVRASMPIHGRIELQTTVDPKFWVLPESAQIKARVLHKRLIGPASMPGEF